MTVGLLPILLLVQCKQEYIPNVKDTDITQLVVEGYINSAVGPTTIRLSRSSDLEDTIFKPEFNAQVNVEGEDGSSFPLYENGNGEYTNAQLTTNNGIQY